jgi:hypothetical protein
MHKFSKYLKMLVLSDCERFTLATQSLRDSMNQVMLYNFGNMKEDSTFWNDKYLSENIHINIDGIDLAWFEEVVINESKNQLEIGHFALDKCLVGQGLAKKILCALKDVCVSELDIKKILFKERGQYSGYPSFYQNKIGAVAQPSFPRGSGVDYLWSFD